MYKTSANPASQCGWRCAFTLLLTCLNQKVSLSSRLLQNSKCFTSFLIFPQDIYWSSSPNNCQFLKELTSLNIHSFSGRWPSTFSVPLCWVGNQESVVPALTELTLCQGNSLKVTKPNQLRLLSASLKAAEIVCRYSLN